MKIALSLPIVNKSIGALKDLITPVLSLHFGSNSQIVNALKAVPATVLNKLLPIVVLELDTIPESDLETLLNDDYENPIFIKNAIHIANTKLNKTLSPEVIKELKPILSEIFGPHSQISAIINACTDDVTEQNLPAALQALDTLTQQDWEDVMSFVKYAYSNRSVTGEHLSGLIKALHKLSDYLSNNSLEYLKPALSAILIHDKYVIGIIESVNDDVTKNVLPDLLDVLKDFSANEFDALLQIEESANNRKIDPTHLHSVVAALSKLSDFLSTHSIESVKPILGSIIGEDTYAMDIIRSCDESITQDTLPTLLKIISQLNKAEIAALISSTDGDIKVYHSIFTKLQDLQDVITSGNIESFKPVIKAIFGQKSPAATIIDSMDGKLNTLEITEVFNKTPTIQVDEFPI